MRFIFTSAVDWFFLMKIMYKIIIIIIIRNEIEFKLVQCFFGKKGRNNRNDNYKKRS